MTSRVSPLGVMPGGITRKRNALHVLDRRAFAATWQPHGCTAHSDAIPDAPLVAEDFRASGRAVGGVEGSVEPLLVSDDQFWSLVERHARLAAEGFVPIPGTTAP